MRHDADRAARVHVVPQNIAHPVVNLRHVVLDIFVPVRLLVLHILLGHADLAVEKVIDAGVKVFEDVFLQRVALRLGEKLRRVLGKAGIVHRRGGVDHGVVVIEHKAGVGHKRDSFLILFIKV